MVNYSAVITSEKIHQIVGLMYEVEKLKGGETSEDYCRAIDDVLKGLGYEFDKLNFIQSKNQPEEEPHDPLKPILDKYITPQA